MLAVKLASSVLRDVRKDLKQPPFQNRCDDFAPAGNIAGVLVVIGRLDLGLTGTKTYRC